MIVVVRRAWLSQSHAAAMLEWKQLIHLRNFKIQLSDFIIHTDTAGLPLMDSLSIQVRSVVLVRSHNMIA